MSIRKPKGLNTCTCGNPPRERRRVYCPGTIIKLTVPALILTTFTGLRCFAGGLDEASVQRATKEVDKPALPEHLEWSVRKKPVIRKENGEPLIKEEEEKNDTIPDYLLER